MSDDKTHQSPTGWNIDDVPLLLDGRADLLGRFFRRNNPKGFGRVGQQNGIDKAGFDGCDGDPLFCQAGIDVDAQLKRLKATPAIAMGTCEDDFETDMYMLTAEIHYSNQRFSNYKTRCKLPSRFKNAKQR